MNIKPLTLTLALLLPACSAMHYTDAQGRTLSLVRVGQDSTIGELDAQAGADNITIKNYTSDQGAAIKAAASAITEALQKIPALP